MRTIRRLLLLAILGVGGVAAYSYWSGHDWPLGSRAAMLNSEAAKKRAGRLANQAATKATDAAHQLGGTLGESALTAKITSKMALDDYVHARAIDVNTSGSVVTLTGAVASADERQRAVRLARETEGVTRVVDQLQIRKP